MDILELQLAFIFHVCGVIHEFCIPTHQFTQEFTSIFYGQILQFKIIALDLMDELDEKSQASI